MRARCQRRDAGWGDHVAGLERLAGAYLGARDAVELIDRDEIASRIRWRQVQVLDVRPHAEFAAGHLGGARSVPITELRHQLRVLPKDVEVVADYRGPYLRVRR